VPVSGLAWAHILKEIKREKDKRHHELLVIERRKKILEEQKRQTDQAKLFNAVLAHQI